MHNSGKMHNDWAQKTDREWIFLDPTIMHLKKIGREKLTYSRADPTVMHLSSGGNLQEDHT